MNIQHCFIECIVTCWLQVLQTDYQFGPEVHLLCLLFHMTAWSQNRFSLQNRISLEESSKKAVALIDAATDCHSKREFFEVVDSCRTNKKNAASLVCLGTESALKSKSKVTGWHAELNGCEYKVSLEDDILLSPQNDIVLHWCYTVYIISQFCSYFSRCCSSR